MIDDRILNLLDTLSNYHRSREDCIFDALNFRLDKSLETYTLELDASLNYLAHRKPDKLMRKLNK